MKLHTILILSSFGAVGCSVPNDSSIRFLNPHEFTFGQPSSTGCTPQAISIYRGSLDLAGYTQYTLAFDWESVLTQINTSISGDPLAGPQRNEFVLDHLIFSYDSMPGITFQPEQMNADAVVQPGAGVGGGGSKWFGMNLLTPQAQRALIDRVQVGESPYELRVSFQAFGSLASGAKISSNKVAFPLSVYRSSFAGCRADIRAPTGPCGVPGGQDGTVVGCCRDLTPRPAGCPAQ